MSAAPRTLLTACLLVALALAPACATPRSDTKHLNETVEVQYFPFLPMDQAEIKAFPGAAEVASVAWEIVRALVKHVIAKEAEKYTAACPAEFAPPTMIT